MTVPLVTVRERPLRSLDVMLARQLAASARSRRRLLATVWLLRRWVRPRPSLGEALYAVATKTLLPALTVGLLPMINRLSCDERIGRIFDRVCRTPGHSDATRRASAFHEAGHAVVAFAYDFKVGDLSIRGDGGVAGYLNIQFQRALTIAEGRKQLAVFMAGELGSRLSGAAVDHTAGLAGDTDDIRELVSLMRATLPEFASIDVGQLLHDCRHRAEAILNEHQDDVRRIAEALLADGRLSAAGAARIANRLHVTYTNKSATAIAQDIVARFCPGFTSSNVQANLPTIAAISFMFTDVSDALQQVATWIGGTKYIDYFKDLHLYVGAEPVQNPTDLTPTHPTLYDFTSENDLTQVITRLFGQGGGANALQEIDAGETIIPVGTTTWYDPTGGAVRSGSQAITYTGADAGGGGTLVGPGASPSSAPALGVAAGTGLSLGVYSYAYTDVTAAGESIPSPLGTITVSAASPPSTPLGNNGMTFSGGSMTPGTYQYAITIQADGETTAGPTLSVTIIAGFGDTQLLFIPQSVPAGATLNLYRTVNGGSQLKFVANITNSTPIFPYFDRAADSSLGVNVPVVNTASVSQVSITGIAIGASPTTSRNVYRTAVNASQLKRLTTIGDNTTTAYTDSTADGSLGVNAPTSDTSGLTQPSGQILAGASTLLVAGAGAFASTGGWAIIGNGQQVIRYTGIGGNTLTGIPSTGIGAIAATIAYNSTITAAPALTGVPASGAGAVLYSILKNDPVNLLVTVNDSAAQIALAALRLSTLGVHSDGIIEDFLDCGSASYAETLARTTAALNQRKNPEIRIRYKCRDPLTRAGLTITVNLPAPQNVAGAFRIKQVTISDFQPQNSTLYPVYTVQASTTRFSLDDLLRIALRKAA